MKGKIMMAIFLVAVTAMCVSGPGDRSGSDDTWNDGKIKKFDSPEAVSAYIKERSTQGSWGGTRYYAAMESAPMVVVGCGGGDLVTAGAPLEKATDFSTTNIQVQGVDEADIVKNDGKYIYILSGNVVTVIDAYPAEDARTVSTISVEGNPAEMYLSGNRLMVLGNAYREDPVPLTEELMQGEMYMPTYYPQISTSFLKIYDITDREELELEREITVDGSYFDSRMIGDNVYIIVNQPPGYNGGDIRIPEVNTGTGTLTPDVFYFEDIADGSYTFTSVIAVNISDGKVDGNIYLLGSTQDLYVSMNNIYLTNRKWVSPTYKLERAISEVIKPLVPEEVGTNLETVWESNRTDMEKERAVEDVLDEYLRTLSDQGRRSLEQKAMERMDALDAELMKESEKTVVRRIEITDGKVYYRATGEVPGRVLNQFSMDEHEGYFRIATTTGQVSKGGSSSGNHVYVLDGKMNITGALEDLAPGEKIYSARFMGDRAYLVTFKKVDPLFVIDLADPENPQVLGKLKIPGYSDYLHPYDEDHIIGIGKDTMEAETGDFAWYQGVKLALFDVSDVDNPKEISKYVIGDRGTDSEALRDHKAFLFSREKNLMVIPVLLAEIDEEKYPEPSWGPRYGEYTWQGAYVFRIDTENGIQFRGGITHAEDDKSYTNSGWYYQGGRYAVKRSLYMDDTLYTISDSMVKMNDLWNLEEVNRVELPGYKEEPRYFVME